MKNYNITTTKSIKKILFASLILLLTFSMSSCEDNTLPEAGSKPDLTPPSAKFSYAASPVDYREITFTNESISALDYTWDFGGGNTSTDTNPVFTFSGEGTFSVSLTAKDGNGVTSQISMDVVVVDILIPAFLCHSFECSDRSPWSDGNGGSTYSGSSGPTPPDGSTGAKLSANSTSKFLGQTIRVSNSTTYQISFWYVSKNSSNIAGRLLIEDADDNSEFLKVDVPISATTGTYEKITYTVTTNATTNNLRFFMGAGNVESRFDLVEIKKI